MTATIPTTLAEYQKYVREQVLDIQQKQGMSDENMNAHLRALGLPEKRNFYVPVEITGKMTAIINMVDAESEAEARAKVAAMTDSAMRTQLRHVSTGNFTGLTGKVIALPETFAVGDQDLTLSNPGISGSAQTREERRQCENYRSTSSAYCTLRRGHGGDQHAAGNGMTIVAVWPTES